MGPERLTWLGHATVLLELGGARLLTDPLLRARLGPLRRHGDPPAPGASRTIDAVLISHLHYDHLDVPSLRRLGGEVAVLAPRGSGRFLRRLGFRRTTEMRPGESVAVSGAVVTAVPARHDGRRRPLGPVGPPIGFVIAGSRRVYFAGDTDLYEGMAALAAGLDVALLPVWGWGPTLGSGHMDPRGAARATALLRPCLAVPIHWGTYFPIGLSRLRGDALVQPPLAFERHVRELAPETQARVLAPGETLELGTACCTWRRSRARAGPGGAAAADVKRVPLR
jgi:L-ascorbate metabolism protein UlaG (beta-lactamase superfamily)